MKKLMMGAFAALVFTTSALAAEKSETLKVNGWHCAGCSARTEAALKDLAGVKTVSTDKGKNEVRVTYDDAKVKHADLQKAVADSGFSVAP